MRKLKALDFVKTPKGAIAIVTEISTTQDMHNASIRFLGEDNSTGEKNAWWFEEEGLVLIDNLPSLLSRCLIHPFGTGLETALETYPIK